jgi:hypothetical protein
MRGILVKAAKVLMAPFRRHRRDESVCWPRDSPEFVPRPILGRDKPTTPSTAFVDQDASGSLAPSMGEIELLRWMDARLQSLRGVGTGAVGRKVVAGFQDAIRRKKLDLPRIPDVAQDLMNLTSDSMLDFRQIGHIISRDQDLVARILQVANSPVYTHQAVTSLEQAVAVLGLDSFCDIVVGVVSGSALYRVPGFELPVAKERDHSMEVAMVASSLCRSMGYEEGRNACFLGGLLHDAGRVLVLRILANVRRRHKLSGIGHYLTERLMDDLHVPLGLYYGLHRGVTPEVRNILMYHHRPQEAPEEAQPYVMLVAIADALSDSALPLSSTLLPRQIADHLGLDPANKEQQGRIEQAAVLMTQVRGDVGSTT